MTIIGSFSKVFEPKPGCRLCNMAQLSGAGGKVRRKPQCSAKKERALDGMKPERPRSAAATFAADAAA